MISINANQRRLYYEWIQKREFTKNLMNSAFSFFNQEKHVYDGLIHSSGLDWNKEPQKQFDAMLKRGAALPDRVKRVSRAGELYHNDMQKIYNFAMGEKTAWIEKRILLPSIKFSGTPDRLQFWTPIGNILFEFKTISKVKRDSTMGDRIYRKLEEYYGEEKKCLAVSPLTDKEIKFLKKMMGTYDNVMEDPVEDHMTQMFTYVWICQKLGIQIDWAFLVYIYREDYDFTEFAYSIPHCQHLVQRAEQNYGAVYQCLMNYLHKQSNGLTVVNPSQAA